MEDARSLIARYRTTNLDTVLSAVGRYWEDVLGAVRVKTPDRPMDIMLNGWLLYQTLACRMWARSAFYQASGAYGFRDQLQDGTALVASRPEITREHLLRAAARQFVEGDVQHWWLPESGQGVRTRISDDRAWLAYATVHYIDATGDAAVLDEVIPFLEGPSWRWTSTTHRFRRGRHAVRHCARGLDQSLTFGAHGLPLIGTGDWNDGMNRVGYHGEGSVGWLLCSTPLHSLRSPIYAKRRARRWRAEAAALGDAFKGEATETGICAAGSTTVRR